MQSNQANHNANPITKLWKNLNNLNLYHLLLTIHRIAPPGLNNGQI